MYCEFVVQHAVQQRVQQGVYSKSTLQIVRPAKVHIKSNRAYNKSTASQHVKMLYGLSYDLFSNRSTRNRNSGVCAQTMLFVLVLQ